jgi:hypothetical protein
MALNPYEEAALCRESSRLRDEALRRLDGETVAIDFTPERKVRRKARRMAGRSKPDTGSVALAQAIVFPVPTTPPGRDNARGPVVRGSFWKSSSMMPSI